MSTTTVEQVTTTDAERYAAGLQEIVEARGRERFPILWLSEAEGGHFNGKYSEFSVDKPGAKFTRIVERSGGQRHVHAFVENATGYVFKAAGWKAPAKGPRYTSIDAALEALRASGGMGTGYLYR